MDLIEQYQALSSEVNELDSKFIELSATNSSVKKHYKGCRILMSPFFKNPRILVIGINPGGGSAGTKLNPSKENEYSYGFQLAKETRKVFELAGVKPNKEWLNSNMIKTNHHYFSTIDVKGLHALYGNIKWNEINPHHKANDWTKRLIEMTEPAVILCEGLDAFKGVYKSLSGEDFQGCSEGDVFETEHSGYKLIGYKRLRSHIKAKALLAEALSPFLLEEAGA